MKKKKYVSKKYFNLRISVGSVGVRGNKAYFNVGLGAQGLLADRDLYRAIPAVTGFFFCLIL
jgi:hypothetical protein